ncbi:Crp/Fnr family transcriptional regulator [Roseibium sp. MMSF_3412]|uniref:Crp/Fnr family transcriptional regulator n=1 Tax=Roseibium sp. MMSF_3412 TaxID=3046712 RepID=UPI00273D5C6C|nr:helix-turn-helix domain-containing protein [Roseibium sp. MMSF_3412]
MNSHDILMGGKLACSEAMCRSRLCQHVTGGHLDKKHKVLQRGDRLSLGDGACRKVWIILYGMAAICFGLSDGRRQILGLETSGHIMCGMNNGSQSGSWIEALTETVLCEIDLSSLVSPANAGGPCGDGQRLVTELFTVIHQRLETCSAHLVTLGRLDSTERVTLFLVDIARRLGRPVGQSLYLELPMTREDIADYLGLNTETISRVFSRLKKNRLVQFPSRNAIAIPDPKALERRLPVDIPDLSSTSHVSSFLTAVNAPSLARDGALP